MVKFPNDDDDLKLYYFYKYRRNPDDDFIKKYILGIWDKIQIDDSNLISLCDTYTISKNLLITQDQFLNLPINLINYFIKEFMKLKISQAAIIGKRKELLEYYIEMFNEIPSGSHMVRAYTYMEQIFLDKYSKSEITVDEKQIERFDKLKALALNN